jgi:DNA polymerase-2
VPPQASPGGYVMDSRPGLYDSVLVLDYKSLYPSIIRTFLIDPVGLVEGMAHPDPEHSTGGFLGARFGRPIACPGSSVKSGMAAMKPNEWETNRCRRRLRSS